MAKFLDFEEIKKRYSLLDVAQMLHIQLKKEPTTYRGECPAHPSDDKRKFVVSPTKGEYGAFFCACAGSGGYDCIALTAHVLGCSQKEAADAISKHFGISTSTSTLTGKVPTQPESEARSESTKNAQLLAIAQRLESDHLAVEAAGFDPAFAKEHGIGYDPKGATRGKVLVPFRDKQGELLGYISGEDLQLPRDFQSNVVKLHPKTA